MKPANIKLPTDGMVKVLNFGLAAVAPDPSRADGNATYSPTLTLAATRAGVILGTAAYMSPEQASGKPVDKHADIWSFGVVVWEMLTGTRLFDGETISYTLADVLRAGIDFDKLPRGTPAAIRRLLRRCLDRDTKRRLRDIGEARIVIDEACGGGGQESGERIDAATAARWRRSMPSLLAAIVAGAMVGLAVWNVKPSTPRSPVMRFTLPVPDSQQLERLQAVAISPDGTLAYVSDPRSTTTGSRDLAVVGISSSISDRRSLGDITSTARSGAPSQYVIGMPVAGIRSRATNATSGARTVSDCSPA